MQNIHYNYENLEKRKKIEIEHSRQRRVILQSDERRSDTHISERPKDLDSLIRDKENFKYHFSNVKFYSITHSSETYLHDWLNKKCKPGIKVLDFACGNGENGVYAAKCNAEVIGIDISPEGVANSNLNAQKAGVVKNCSFEVMDGENMTFADNTFDLCVEYGALHHVKLEKALFELNRVLKPDGEMICIEALRHNPLIHFYRRMTPHLRTEWEINHIIGIESLDIISKYFYEVNAKFFHLAVLIAVPFRKTFIFKPLRCALEFFDKILLRKQSIGKYGWLIAITMSKPKKNK